MNIVVLRYKDKTNGLIGLDTHGRVSSICTRKEVLWLPVCLPVHQVSSEKGSAVEERRELIISFSVGPFSEGEK